MNEELYKERGKLQAAERTIQALRKALRTREAELAALRKAAKEDVAADIECWQVDESDKEQHYNAIERKDIAHKRLASLLQEKGG